MAASNNPDTPAEVQQTGNQPTARPTLSVRQPLRLMQVTLAAPVGGPAVGTEEGL